MQKVGLPLGRWKVAALALFLFACSSPALTLVSPQDEVQRIRTVAGFPPSALTFIESTKMTNSPNGDLQVDVYEDEQGRKFFVDSVTTTVVEIDARTLLQPASDDSVPSLSSAELEAWALEFVRSAVPDFSLLQGSLTYEPGGKGDMQFFTWRVVSTENFFMPPFIQVGLTESGELFAFYNTVTLGAD